MAPVFVVSLVAGRVTLRLPAAVCSLGDYDFETCSCLAATFVAGPIVIDINGDGIA